MSIRETSREAERDNPPGRRPLAFGATDFVGALAARLERSFARAGDEDALVVGIYGAWGSGKTTVLRALEERFEAATEKAAERAGRPEPDSEAGSGAGQSPRPDDQSFRPTRCPFQPRRPWPTNAAPGTQLVTLGGRGRG